VLCEPTTRNKAEEFAPAVSGRSFLSLWCDCNPRGKSGGKELRDILGVCAQHVIIGVKEVHYQSDKAPGERWPREPTCTTRYASSSGQRGSSQPARQGLFPRSLLAYLF
jgi:hypothetical protein